MFSRFPGSLGDNIVLGQLAQGHQSHTGQQLNKTTQNASANLRSQSIFVVNLIQHQTERCQQVYVCRANIEKWQNMTDSID